MWFHFSICVYWKYIGNLFEIREHWESFKKYGGLHSKNFDSFNFKVIIGFIKTYWEFLSKFLNVINSIG